MHLKCELKRIFKCVETDAVLYQPSYQVNWDLVEDWSQCFCLSPCIVYIIRMKTRNFVSLGFFSCIAPLKVFPRRQQFCGTCYRISRAYFSILSASICRDGGLGEGWMRLLFFSISRAYQRFHFPRFLNVFPRQPPASYFPAHRCPFFPRSAIFLVSLVCVKISNHSNNLFHLSFVCWFLQPILEAGAVNLLSNLTRRQETALRLNGVWALMVSVAKNLCLRADGILE